MDTILHGGRLQQAQRRYPDAPRPFIDLSTGINPAVYSFTLPGSDVWCRLPEPEDVQALEAVAARAYGVGDTAMVVAVPGTQAAIQLLPWLFPQRRISIAGPTYAEHAAAWQAAGALVVPAGDASAQVVCNPNNPDGTRHDPAALRAQAPGLDLLVVDEAFVDFEPGLSLGPYLPLPRVVILRSFGKAYGLAGLRLGFALAEPQIAVRIRDALGPWAISGPAIAIGREALADQPWRDTAAVIAHGAAARLDALLTRSGLRPVGGTATFRTVATDAAQPLAERLAQAGILVRAFDAVPTWLRFGLPPNEDAWTRLAAVL